MKKYLLLILASVLSISGYAVQKVTGTAKQHDDGTWYSAILGGQYDVR
jgi:hypothetical protein